MSGSGGGTRIRDFGVRPGILAPGAHNAVTDVAGVLVGHVTLVDGESVRTGVTAVRPHGGDVFLEKVHAGVFVGNGFGKTAGLVQVGELGTLESPVVLTNTLSVAAGIEGSVRWVLSQSGGAGARSVNAVVGECNDAALNDIRAMAVSPGHVVEAIEGARGGPVREGCVGAGTGTVSFGFKSGIGTSSRALPKGLGGWTVGVLVQSNFGGVLTIDGRRVGERLGRHAFREAIGVGGRGEGEAGDEEGSCMVVVATDAPLCSRRLGRLARRAVLGLARTGAFMSNGSGDVVIAFSTAQRVRHGRGERVERMDVVPDERMSPLFLGAVEATEEAVYNALVAAESMTGYGGRRVDSIDHGVLRGLLA